MLAEVDFHSLPVVSGKKLVGIVTSTDLIQNPLCSSKTACTQMKLPIISFHRSQMIWGIAVLAASCAPQAAVEKNDDPAASFTRVKPVLEHNCVHCHAANRITGMPSLTDTQALAGLVGPGNLIVPGKPEQSRFYVVATLSDDEVGAMPPTGHALSAKETNILKEWILNGATLPEENMKLVPRGTSPRSR